MKSGRSVIITLMILSVGGICLLPIPQWAYGASDLVISHVPGECVAAGIPILMTATINSSSSVEEARLYFKTPAMPSYYFVRMAHSSEAIYRGMLPALNDPDMVLEYRIVAVDAAATIARSPIFYTLSRIPADCAEQPPALPDAPILVYAEEPLPPSEDFSGAQVQWNTTTGAELVYLASHSKNSSELQGQTSLPDAISPSESGASRISTLKLLGIGAGVGTAAVASALLLKEPKDEIDWTIDLTHQAKKVKVEIVKVPQIQTSCGVWVNNQLYVSNSNSAAITIGTIQYEIMLTKDNPAGSCESGRIGTFAPNWATVVQPGARVLVREWANEVNPCSGCPYLSAECRWNSRYIVQTSVGEAAAETVFTVKGNLCGGASLKSPAPRALFGDVEP